MKLRLIWAGTHGDLELAEAIDRYVTRVKHFYPVEITEIPPERGRQGQSDVAIMRAQSARLLSAIPEKGHVAVLDERGQLFDSLKFAKWLERLTIDSPYGITFVIGGDVGLDETVRKRADTLLSLSPMTLPHIVARVVLVEQIYRACTLIRNISYHK
ncbi:MAG TPA: 23S rRNA (pseudouridine(1915)-N(3))-methyltransferase RlmH [Thermoanaerobaculia bacterium]